MTINSERNQVFDYDKHAMPMRHAKSFKFNLAMNLEPKDAATVYGDHQLISKFTGERLTIMFEGKSSSKARIEAY